MSKIKKQPALFIVSILSVALVIAIFLPWQDVDGEEISGFSGLGIVTMILAGFVAIETSMQGRGHIKKIPVPPPVLILVPSVLALITTTIKFFVDSEGRQAAAYAGLALAIGLVVAAYINARAMINMIRQMRKTMKDTQAPVAAQVSPAAGKPAAAAPVKSADMTSTGASCDGDWAITMDTPMGTQKMTLTLAAAGSELSGKADTPFGVQEFEGGTVDGDDIAWQIIATEPMPMTLNFKATITGDKLDGTAEVPGMGESPFDGTRA